MTEPPKVKLSKGPAEYLRALATGDPQLIAEALEFQRESFRAQVGCYPEELVEVHECPCGATSSDWSACVC